MPNIEFILMLCVLCVCCRIILVLPLYHLFIIYVYSLVDSKYNESVHKVAIDCQ